jgi:hypothetical protein
MTTIDNATNHRTPPQGRNSKHGANTVVLVCALACLALLGLAACGSSSPDSPSEVIARVGPQAITKGMINQWMTPIASEDDYAETTHAAPTGLVAEPANYPACVTALKKLAPIPGQGKPQPQQTTSDLESRCHNLYEAIRYQTTTFLVAAYWNIQFAVRHGARVSSQEIQQLLKRQLGTTEERQNYIQSHRRTLTEQLFDLKLELLQQQLLNKAKTLGKPGYLKLLAEVQASHPQATCNPQYTVEHCKGFKAPGGYPGQPPAVQFQEIGRWRPDTSHGFTGKPVQ